MAPHSSNVGFGGSQCVALVSYKPKNPLYVDRTLILMRPTTSLPLLPPVRSRDLVSTETERQHLATTQEKRRSPSQATSTHTRPQGKPPIVTCVEHENYLINFPPRRTKNASTRQKSVRPRPERYLEKLHINTSGCRTALRATVISHTRFALKTRRRFATHIVRAREA